MRRSILWSSGVLWVALGAVLLIGGIGYAGFLMAGSFTISNPEHIDHWRRVSYAYLVTTGICSLLALALAVALYRRRKTSPGKDR